MLLPFVAFLALATRKGRTKKIFLVSSSAFLQPGHEKLYPNVTARLAGQA